MRRNNQFAAVGVLLCLFLLSGILSSCSEEPANRTEDTTLRQQILWGANWLLPDVTSFENLTLDSCARIALVKNTRVQSLRQQLLSAHQDLRLNENFFDIKGNLSLQHDQDVYTPEVELGGTSLVFDTVRNEFVEATNRTPVIDDDTTTLSLEFAKQLKTGGVISVHPYLRESDYQNNQWSSNISVGLTQPLLDGFGRTVATTDLESARISLESSENTLASEVKSLLVDVIGKYYELQKSMMLLQERQLALQRSRDQLRAVKIRRQEGEVTQLDVLQSELQVASNANSLLSIQNDLQSKLLDLKLKMGLPLDYAFSVQSVNINFATVELDFDHLAGQALDHRLDLRNRELSLEQSKIYLAKTRNQLLPDLNVYANYSFYDADDDLDRTWDLDQGAVNVGAVLQFPIGDVQEKVRWQKAELSVKQAEISCEDSRRQILSELDTIKRQIETLRNQIQVLKKNVEAAEESFRLANLSYEVGGLISSFDLSESQNQLTSARTDYVSALIDYRIALVNLDRVIGLSPTELMNRHLGTSHN